MILKFSNKPFDNLKDKLLFIVDDFENLCTHDQLHNIDCRLAKIEFKIFQDQNLNLIIFNDFDQKISILLAYLLFFMYMNLYFNNFFIRNKSYNIIFLFIYELSKIYISSIFYKAKTKI